MKHQKLWDPLKQALILLLSLALGIGGLYLAVGEELFRSETYRIQNFSTVLVVLAGVAFVGKWLGPSVRIGLLCRRQGMKIHYHSAILVHLAGMFFAAFTPNNTGMAPATAAALTRVGVPLGRGLGIVIQVLILDLIFFAWSVPASIGYLVYSNKLQFPQGVAAAASVTVIISLVGAVVLTRYPRLVTRLILAAAKWRIMERFASRIRGIARDYLRSGRAFLKLSAADWIALNLATIAGWFSSFTLFWLLLQLYGVENVGLTVTLAILTSLTVVSHFIPTPGASGFMEAAVGFSVGTAADGSVAAALLIWRFASFYSIFLMGPFAGWLLYLPDKEASRTLRE